MDAMIKRSLFTDTTEEYFSPSEPQVNEKVTLRFRAMKDAVDTVTFVCGEQEVVLNKVSSNKMFDMFEATYQVGNEAVCFYYKVVGKDVNCYYDLRGAVDEIDLAFAFRVIPGFTTPDWAKGAIFYQIYVDRFFNGDKSNDVLTGEYKYNGNLVTRKEDWYEGVSDTGIGEFYGGDLEGVLQKMDYLQEIGVEVIYFNPLFVSPSNHKYDSQDYDHIDPHFGKIVKDEGELLTSDTQENREATRHISRVTEEANLTASDELFVKVVEEAHKRGMKVILDGVFNHCGSFNKWLDRERIYENAQNAEKGAYIEENSPYHDYFYFTQNQWPYNENYESWWDYDTLPKLNYESQKLYDYIMYIARKWVSAPFNADGWRLDVAADLGHTPELNHRFWQDFRKNVKEANPEALILAEHYGDCLPWLNGIEWDSVMNYDAFMEPLTWFLTGLEKHSDEYKEELVGNTEVFWNSMNYCGAKFTNSSRMVAMNELSNHDHSRFLSRTSRKVGRITTLGAEAADEGNKPAVMREAVVMQMTWPGAPTMYYGDEAGLAGFTDPDNRRTYPWGKEDMQMLNFHKAMTRIHKQNKELRIGSLKRLQDEEHVIAYGRMYNNESCVVIMNNDDKTHKMSIPVWELGIPMNSALKRIMYSTENEYTEKAKYVAVKEGKIWLELPATSAVVLKYTEKAENLKKFLAFLSPM